jgi:hypothetical protein
MLHAAEARQRGGAAPDAHTWTGRVQESVMGLVARRVAEQRVLWSLRGETAATLAHPATISFAAAVTQFRELVRRDYYRHRRWLVIDAILLVGSGILAPVPGPNLIAYYFAFRVVGHWLSMQGARQGLDGIEWSSRECPPLDELQSLPMLDESERAERLRDINARLRLQHFAAFYERVTNASL